MAIAAFTGLSAGVVPAGAADSSNTEQATLTRTFIESADGTRLETNVYRPLGVAGGKKVPVIVYVSPYLNTGASGVQPQPHGPAVTRNFPYDLEEAGLFDKGYAFVQVALRGTAGSQGCNDLGGNGEQADVVAAVEWAASQPWSTGRVGLWGHSYDGWTGMMALANEPKGLAAVVADAPIVTPYEVLHMNRSTYLTAGYLADTTFQYFDLLPPSVASGQEAVMNAIVGSATSRDCYAHKAVRFRETDPSAPVWAERDLRRRARGSDKPVLLSFGFADELARPTQFPPLWRSLTGPKHAWFGQWGHNAASAPDPGSWWPDELVGRAGFSKTTMRFFDRYLARRAVSKLPTAVVERSDGRWRAARSWPPRGVRRARLELLVGSYRDAPGNSADGRGAEVPQIGRLPAMETGSGSWSVSSRVSRPIHIAGVPKLRAELGAASLGATLVGVVYDVAPDGKATVISRGAMVLGRSTEPVMSLYPQDWLVRSGHRIAVLLTGSDDSTYTPGLTLRDVSIAGGWVELPLVCSPRASNLRGEASARAKDRPSIEVPQIAIESDDRVSGPLTVRGNRSRAPVCGHGRWA